MDINKVIKKLLSILLMTGLVELSVASINHLDGIKAIVNDSVLTYSEYQQQLTLYKAQKRQNKLSEEERKLILDNWINQTLQLQVAKQNKLELSDEELAMVINSIAKDNNLTVDKLLEEVRLNTGMDKKHYLNSIRNQVIISRLTYGNFGSLVEVSDQEILNEFKRRFKTDHIRSYHVIDLVYVNEEIEKTELENLIKRNAWVERLQRAEGKLEIQKIDNFEQSWVINDLGSGMLNSFPEIFHPQLMRINRKGEVSDLIHAENGWHWLKVLDIEEQPAETIRKQIQQELFQSKLMQKLEQWTKEIREQSYIQIN